DNGQYCDSSTGNCTPNRCLAIQCGVGQQCVPSAATKAATDPSVRACETDPCLTISCPGECWSCSITTDGVGTCLLNKTCQAVNTQVGQHGGGESGCSCEVGGGASRSGWLTLAMGLVLI